MLPFITCLCPTYKRPQLLENAIACFLAQDYPEDRRELLIFDDAGQIIPHKGRGWEVISTSRRFNSLPAKFNAIVGLAKKETDIYAVWEDDDVYLPHHLRVHSQAVQASGYSKPSKVWSTYTGKMEQEGAAGRFHASIAFTAELFKQTGGWPLVHTLNFDQIWMARLALMAVGACGDPTSINTDPSYVFRWGSTNAYHGQALGHDDWYDKAGTLPLDDTTVVRLRPRFDNETQQCYRHCGYGVDSSPPGG